MKVAEARAATGSAPTPDAGVGAGDGRHHGQGGEDTQGAVSPPALALSGREQAGVGQDGGAVSSMSLLLPLLLPESPVAVPQNPPAPQSPRNPSPPQSLMSFLSDSMRSEAHLAAAKAATTVIQAATEAGQAAAEGSKVSADDDQAVADDDHQAAADEATEEGLVEVGQAVAEEVQAVTEEGQAEVGQAEAEDIHAAMEGEAEIDQGALAEEVQAVAEEVQAVAEEAQAVVNGRASVEEVAAGDSSTMSVGSAEPVAAASAEGLQVSRCWRGVDTLTCTYAANETRQVFRDA